LAFGLGYTYKNSEKSEKKNRHGKMTLKGVTKKQHEIWDLEKFQSLPHMEVSNGGGVGNSSGSCES
jgi:hypothetical protein